MKKKLLAMLLCTAMAVSVCACGDADTNETQNAENNTVAEQPSITEMPAYDDMSAVLSGDYEITDEIVARYFTEVLYDANVGLVKVTDRNTVQEGDIVKTDYIGYQGEEAFQGGTAADQWIDVSNNCSIDTSTGASAGGYIDGFTDGLVGAKVGVETASQVTFPENYGNTDLAGQEVTFKFTVKEIYTEMTPEKITDEFVKENLSKTYEVSTVEELMVFLREELAYNFTMNYLILNAAFDIPETYVDARLKDYQAYFEELYCKDIALEDYLAYYGYTIEAMQVEWAESLQSQIKAELIFDQVVKDNKLELDEKGHEEYISKITSINSEYFPDADSIHKYAGAGNAQTGENYLKTQTAVRKFMLDNYRNLNK